MAKKPGRRSPKEQAERNQKRMAIAKARERRVGVASEVMRQREAALRQAVENARLEIREILTARAEGTVRVPNLGVLRRAEAFLQMEIGNAGRTLENIRKMRRTTGKAGQRVGDAKQAVSLLTGVRNTDRELLRKIVAEIQRAEREQGK